MNDRPDPASLLMPVGNLSVLFVMATEQEYGSELRRVVRALITGVGPVEAATQTAAALGTLAARNRLPDLVFSLGSAGSRTLDHAAIYQIASVSYRDMDATPLGFSKGVTPFLGEPATIPIPHRLSGVPAVSISSGGAVVSGARYEGVEAAMVDMETYAVFRAAQAFGVPMVGLRGITDGRNELTKLPDWTAYLSEIDAKLAAAVETFFADVEAGRFRL